MEQEEKYVTATQAIRMLGWTRKYFYRVIQELRDRENLELDKSHGFPPQRLIPVSLVTTLKANWKKQKQGGFRRSTEKPGFLEDDE